jgi:hypothetical protein
MLVTGDGYRRLTVEIFDADSAYLMFGVAPELIVVFERGDAVIITARLEGDPSAPVFGTGLWRADLDVGCRNRS